MNILVVEEDPKTDIEGVKVVAVSFKHKLTETILKSKVK
jgi:hypothetical protein